MKKPNKPKRPQGGQFLNPEQGYAKQRCIRLNDVLHKKAMLIGGSVSGGIRMALEKFKIKG